jgi:uncharacterized protein (TIGR02270 family)
MTDRRIVPFVVAQHSEDAAFHWNLRDDAVCAPHYSLRRLERLEARLEGHLDGLRVSGRPGWELCRAELRARDPGGVFVAGVLALESGDATRVGEVFAIALQEPGQARALASTLGWLEWDVVRGYVEGLASSDVPLARRVAVAAYALHRTDPERRLHHLLADDEAIVRARALRAVGELGREDLGGGAIDGLTDSDETCQLWAAYSLALLGHGAGVDRLRTLVERDHPLAARAAVLAARATPLDDAHAWHHRLRSDVKRRRVAIQVAGAIGDPAVIPWLLAAMDEPPVARVAGEAFATITGVDLAYDDLERGRPADLEVRPNDDPTDEDVSMDEDQHLPFPEPRLVADWWSRNGASFRTGTRYLAGDPIARPALDQALRKRRQRVRAAAALELALLHRGQRLFEIRAPAARQRAALGS